MILRTSTFSIMRALGRNRVSWSILQSFRRYKSTIEQPVGYDIVISGGGMVGIGLLCALGSNPILNNKRILLLEREKYRPMKSISPDYSNRVVALNPGSVELLSEIGVWPRVTSKRVKRVENMQVWDSCSESLITFKNDSSAGEVAHIVENDVVLASLTEQYEALKKDNLDIMYEADIASYDLSCSNEDEAVQVQLADGRVLNTHLLVGADGANSHVRNEMKVNYIKKSYNQSAIVATLKLSEDGKNDTAWQRFLPSGPVALLPLNDQLSSLVWTTSKSECRKLLDLSDEQFIDALNQAIYDDSEKSPFVESATNVMSGLLTALGSEQSSALQLPPGIMGVVEKSRASFPLSVGHASNYVGKGVALVGDAAHKVHPLAGQGVNLGFGDVKCLVEQLAHAVYDGSHLNDLEYLEKYEADRQKHVVPTVLAIHGLNHLYSTDFAPLVLIRSLGLQVTNSFPTLKRKIIEHASG